MRPVAVVGPGAAGRALASALVTAGWPVAGILARDAVASAGAAAALSLPDLGASTRPAPGWQAAGIVLLAVRDRDVAEVARSLAIAGPWSGRTAAHLSGLLGASALEPLRLEGAACAAFHPLATFPRESPALPRGTPFGVEGDEPALEELGRLAAALGGHLLRVDSAARPLYHCAATVAGNLVTALMAAAADMLREAGVEAGEQVLLPLARESLRQAAAQGAAAALTGPLVRGDVATVEAHLEALGRSAVRPRAREAHAVLSLLAIELARQRPDAGVEALDRLEARLAAAAREARPEADRTG